MSGEPWDILDRLGYELRFGKPFGTFDSELNLLCETFFRREIDEAFLYQDGIFFTSGNYVMRAKLAFIPSAESKTGFVVPGSQYSLIEDLRSKEDRAQNAHLVSMIIGAQGAGKILYESDGLIPRYAILKIFTDLLQKAGADMSYWSQKKTIYRKAAARDEIVAGLKGKEETDDALNP